MPLPTISMGYQDRYRGYDVCNDLGADVASFFEGQSYRRKSGRFGSDRGRQILFKFNGETGEDFPAVSAKTSRVSLNPATLHSCDFLIGKGEESRP